MSKKILITGATDGIGLATVKMLLPQGHEILLHGRNPQKLETVAATLSDYTDQITRYTADLSHLAEVADLAEQVKSQHQSLDILINNAGILKTADTISSDGFDMRFAVNTLAPHLLTQKLLPLIPASGRVVNVSSAAQSPVNLDGLAGRKHYATPMEAYAESKLAITMLSIALAQQLGNQGPAIIAVNPGSLLASKMVKEGFGVAGSDLNIGADILTRAALSDEFADASGTYYDNDAKSFANPHPDALQPEKIAAVTRAIEDLLNQTASVRHEKDT